jgi:hypothetical protein
MTRRERLRAFRHAATVARRERDRETWRLAVREWERIATVTERLHPPPCMWRPWEERRPC